MWKLRRIIISRPATCEIYKKSECGHVPKAPNEGETRQNNSNLLWFYNKNSFGTRNMRNMTKSRNVDKSSGCPEIQHLSRSSGPVQWLSRKTNPYQQGKLFFSQKLCLSFFMTEFRDRRYIR